MILRHRLRHFLPSQQTFRLHWFSWIVCGVLATALVLIILPGVYVPPTLLIPNRPPSLGGVPIASNPSGPLHVAEYEHGWPWTYLRRAKGFDGAGWPQGTYNDDPWCEPWLSPDGIIIWWSVPDAWPLGSDASTWRLGPLIGDLLVFSIILVAGTAACEYWIRRRGGFGRFKLIDAFVATAVIAVAITWWRWNTLEAGANRAALEQIKAAEGAIDRQAVFRVEGVVAYAGVEWAYVGPDWLRRLIGSPEFLRGPLYRVEKLAIDERYLNPTMLATLRRFRDLEELWVREPALELTDELTDHYVLLRSQRNELYFGEYQVWGRK